MQNERPHSVLALRKLSLLILIFAFSESMTSPAWCQGMEESIDYGSGGDSNAPAKVPIPAQSTYGAPAATAQPYGTNAFPPQYPTPAQPSPTATFIQPGSTPPRSFAPLGAPPGFLAPPESLAPLQGYASQVNNGIQPNPQGGFSSTSQPHDGIIAPLQGSANLNVPQFDPSLQVLPPPMMSQPFQQPNLIPQNAQTAPPQAARPSLFGNALKSLLSGGVNKNVPPAERPWWIPAHAYTNDAMVAPYHNMDIFWWDKSSMPDKPQWVRLAVDVTRYWNGYVSEPCLVYVEPFKQAPGNFVFHSRQSGGPRGWLQAVNQPDSKGFPLYRYWLDQPQ